MIPTTTINTLAECFGSLSDLGAMFSEAEWKTSTDLPGWSVQDNLSHLIGIERYRPCLGEQPGQKLLGQCGQQVAAG